MRKPIFYAKLNCEIFPVSNKNNLGRKDSQNRDFV